MLNEALDAEIKKLGEDEVIKGYLKHFSDHEFLFMLYDGGIGLCWFFSLDTTMRRTSSQRPERS